jgi:hypothetical protein
MVPTLEMLSFGMWRMLSHKFLTRVSEELLASTCNIDEVNRFFPSSGKYLPYQQSHIPEDSNLQLTYGPNFQKASNLPFHFCKNFTFCPNIELYF